MAKSKSTLASVSDTTDIISIVAEFPALDPNSLFDYWTNPELLRKWWPPVAELRPEVNGSYHFSWPSQNWHLRGIFTEYTRGKELGLTWKWDHESTDVTRVTLKFEPIPAGGTRLTLRHGRYSEDETGKKMRNDHVEGWMYFLKKLQEQHGQAR